MNIKNLHDETKLVSALPIFKASKGIVNALRILENGKLEEHITLIPAMLICVLGKANYADEVGNKVQLNSGDFIIIEPKVKHWIEAEQESNFLLIK